METDENEAENMNYAVVNSDEPTSQEQLEKYTGEVRWEYLKPHFETGNLVWVSPDLDLINVGKAFSDDESNRVASWKQQGLILIPSEPHAKFWEESSALFRALVVSPFVLMQPLDENNV